MHWACPDAPGREGRSLRSWSHPGSQSSPRGGRLGLAVVNVDEALNLRAAGIKAPVVVVGPIFPFEMEPAVEADVSLPVYSPEIAHAVSLAASRVGKPAKIHIKVDTGLGRLAVAVAQSQDFLELCSRLPGLDIEGIYSHYADAEGLDQSYTLQQFRRFREALALCEEVGIRPRHRHISASAAGMLLEEARLDLVRIGIAMYGLWPAEETRILMASRGQDLLTHLNLTFASPEGQRTPTERFLRPALSFKTRVAQVKTIAQGTKIGYGCTYETTRQTTVAILPVGYAEGYDRHLGDLGEVLVGGRRSRVLGRVCMNMITIDITDIPGIEMGDEVVLLGQQGQASISAEEFARKVGTINYEVVTRLPAHLPRVYLGTPPSGL